MLLEGFRRYTVVRQLCVASKLIILIDDLLGRSAHLTLWTGTIKHSIHDVPATRVVIV
jgi:hypothetical protein